MGRKKKSICSAKAPLCTMTKLSELLDAVTTGEGESKQEAELEIRKIEGACRVYPIHLTQLILDPTCRVEIRILASAKLKKIVENHWCSTAKSFLPPEIDSENKEKIKSLLLTGLLESDKEIQKAVADVIVSIAQWDWPYNWARLIETLLTHLNGENECGLHGGLIVIQKIDFRRSDPDSLNDYAVILRQINRIFADENQYSIEIRSLACDMISDECCSIAKLKRSDMVLQYLQSAVSQFCAAAISSWKSDKSNFQLRSTILEGFKTLLDNIPKCIFRHLPDIVPLVWESLIDCAKYYHANIVDPSKTNDDADKTVEGSEAFVDTVLEFIDCTLTGGRWSFTDIRGFELSHSEWSYLHDSFILPHTLRHLITLMELTADEIERWNGGTDIDHFVEQEGLKTHVLVMRRRIEELIPDLMKMKKYALVDAMTIVIMKHLDAENEIRVKGLPGADQKSWQSQEAILLAFGTLKESIISKKIGKSPRYDVVPILKNVVLADLNNSETNPFLMGRCLCIGGLYADLIPPEMASAFLDATSNCLRADQPTSVKIYAVAALYSWYYRDNSRNKEKNDNKKKNKNEDVLKSHVPALMKGLLSFAESQKSQKLLTLILKSVATLMPFDKACTTSVVNRIYSLTEVALLDHHRTNAYHTPWLDVLMELMLNANCVNLVQQRLVPKLLSMLIDIPMDESDERPWRGSAALDIVDTLVDCSPIPLSDLLIDDLFPACCIFLTNSDDWLTLDYGIVLMETYLITSFEQVAFYQDKKGRYGAQYVLQVITRVLNHKSETQLHRMDDACGILLMLINNVWTEIKADTDQLLKAVVFRMRHNKSLETKRTLLVVYAYIINEELDTVLQFLTSASSPPGQRSPLELVISEGFCREYHSFEDEYKGRIENSLKKIFRLGLTDLSSPLHQITFRENSEETIPLLVKICRLIMNDRTSVKRSGMKMSHEEGAEM